ncbi:PfpI endopeptidase-like protein [Venustampulla echinocandica]|uniref:PfpI endopeptidase-like protein n=1 Tax=Venustampulla echinocandica TaxID=2656787 RepID=A0A370TH65_9HELO|nr:PfpI endopeptidase-like protein [Venustampulla echinocandica]RDL34533.1 PfpI endopeptidase-like protein [Venustampulla echinocandica]
MAATKQLRIGVFIPASVQLLDLSGIDLFDMITPEYLKLCGLPPPLISLGVPSTIHYISVPEKGSHVELTAKVVLQVSRTIDDPDVQPGMLDIVLVPGPEPGTIFETKVLEYLRGHAEWKGENGQTTDILSVCTGCSMLGQAGILKGKHASGPRALVPRLRKEFPETSWDDSKRWVQDGNVWTSGGITNGQEMVAAYLRYNFPGPTTEAVLSMADVGEKGLDYGKSVARVQLGWLWWILKALTVGGGKQKKL